MTLQIFKIMSTLTNSYGCFQIEFARGVYHCDWCNNLSKSDSVAVIRAWKSECLSVSVCVCVCVCVCVVLCVLKRTGLKTLQSTSVVLFLAGASGHGAGWLRLRLLRGGPGEGVTSPPCQIPPCWITPHPAAGPVGPVDHLSTTSSNGH